jgi:hypothetical protein
MKHKVQLVIGALIAYYLSFAVVCIWYPSALLQLLPDASLAPLWLFTLIGAMVGSVGLGLFFPFFSPLSHWGILAVVLLGQIALPLCTITLVLRGELPALAGSILALGDIIWIPLLGACLAWIVDMHAAGEALLPTSESLLWDLRPQGSMKTIGELSEKQQLLIVVLRHLGCTFCRETLAELKTRLPELHKAGVGVLVVSMSDPEAMEQIHTRYNLPDVLLLSDPDRLVYRALQIPKGTLSQVFGAKVWRSGLLQGKLIRYGIGSIQGDPFQLSGSALVRTRSVVWQNVTRSAADAVQLSESCTI